MAAPEQSEADGIQYLIIFFVLGMLAIKATAFWLSVALGGIVNSVLAKLLKRVIKQPRPDPSTRATSGMPSSHAHIVFFFAGLYSHHTQDDEIYPVLVLAVAMCTHRVHASYHTWAQCMVGAVVGWCMAGAWLFGPIHTSLMDKYGDVPFDVEVLGAVMFGLLVCGGLISAHRQVVTG